MIKVFCVCETPWWEKNESVENSILHLFRKEKCDCLTKNQIRENFPEQSREELNEALRILETYHEVVIKGQKIFKINHIK